MTDATSIFDTPLGPLLARVSNGRMVELSFYSRARGAGYRSTASHEDAELLRTIQMQLAEYFERKRTRFELPIQLHGPPFQRQVWEALCGIPYGCTVSYGDLAAELGVPGSARAVGAANGANPIAIVVPCHRVIGSDGRLVGYGGGLDRKQFLLDLENVAKPQLLQWLPNARRGSLLTGTENTL